MSAYKSGEKPELGDTVKFSENWLRSEPKSVMNFDRGKMIVQKIGQIDTDRIFIEVGWICDSGELSQIATR